MAEDALVSCVVNKIGDLFTPEIPLIWKVADDVESLKQELQALATFLNTMDYKKRQDAATKNWLSSVRDVAYEAEDLIDTYSLEKRYAPATRIFHSYSLQNGIKQLKSKIRTIFEHRTTYVPNLHEQRSDGSSSGSSSSGAAADQSHLHPWRRSFPHLGDDVVVGLEQDANLIVERLLRRESRRRQVVAITGMGGCNSRRRQEQLHGGNSQGGRWKDQRRRSGGEIGASGEASVKRKTQESRGPAQERRCRKEASGEATAEGGRIK